MAGKAIMDIEATAIPDVKLVRPKRFDDERGFFTETYSRRAYADAGIDAAFVQDNLSLSISVGTVRGLHFQTPPHAQAKLVGVVTGRVLDVAVDLRKGSPRFGHHVAVELSAADGAQLFVPEGFAHGFCTLAPETRVSYKVSAFYAPAHDAGLLWHDLALGIAWPVTPETAQVSEKDRSLPALADLDLCFDYPAVPAS